MRKKTKRHEKYKDSNIEWIGEIPEHWEISRIKNLGILSRGVDLARDEFQDGIYPVYGSNGIIGYHSKYTTKAPCLTVGRSGSVGEVNYVSANFWAHNTTLYLQEYFNNDVRFIFYLFKSLNLQSVSAGSAVGTLNRNVIHQIKIAIPPAEEQKIIAHYLDTKTAQIDRKIDLLTQKAQRYEELKRSLINETVTRGLDKSVPMKDSGIEWMGEIPEHWKVKHFKQFSSMKGRIGWQGLKHSEFIDEGPFLITGMNFKDGKIRWSEVYHITEERYQQAPEIQLREHDVLMTKDGTIGKLLYVDKIPSPHKASLNSHLLVFRPIRNSYFPRYLYYQLGSSVFQGYVEIAKTGTTFFGISQAAVGRYIAILPPISEQKAIAEHLDRKTEHIDQILENINSQIEIQKELRKTLINDVVTGKIKVT